MLGRRFECSPATDSGGRLSALRSGQALAASAGAFVWQPGSCRFHRSCAPLSSRALPHWTSSRPRVKANPGTVLPEVPLSRKFEQIAGANGKAAQDLRDFEDAVVSQSRRPNDMTSTECCFKRTGQRLQWNAWLAGEQARIAAIPAAQRTPDEVKRLAIAQDKSVATWTLPTWTPV